MQMLFEKYGTPGLLVPNTRLVRSWDPRWGFGSYDGETPAQLLPNTVYFREPFGDAPFFVVRRRIKIWSDDVEKFVARSSARGATLVELERGDPHSFVVFDWDVVPLSAEAAGRASRANRVVRVWNWSSMGDSYVEFSRSGGVSDSDELMFIFDESVPTEALPQGGSFSHLDRVADVWDPVAHHFEREPTDDEAGWPLTPSPELAAQIEAWIDAVTDNPYSFVGDCQQRRMLPLHSTLIYTWALQSDGTIQWIDHEAFGYPREPETNRAHSWAALEQGTRRYPGLAELLPLRPLRVSRCASCGGAGNEQGEHCFSCNGLGWRC